MKKILFCSVFVSLLVVLSANAQNTEQSQIETTINTYFDGWMTGDTAKVGKAMHATCHLKVYRDGVFRNLDRTQYLSGFKPHAKEAGVEGRIKMIDFKGNIASAKAEIETPKALFVDYFNLIKINDWWFIVDKVSTRFDK
jgi:aldose sugar dehydrogenase